MWTPTPSRRCAPWSRSWSHEPARHPPAAAGLAHGGGRACLRPGAGRPAPPGPPVDHRLLLGLALSAPALVQPTTAPWTPPAALRTATADAPAQLELALTGSPVPASVPLPAPALPLGADVGLALCGWGLLRSLRAIGALRRRLATARPWKRVGGVRVRVDPAAPGPYAARTPLHPVVVLDPRTAAHPEHRRLALRHELQHHAQGDPAFAWLWLLVCGLFGWNPAVRAWRALAEEVEAQACDAAVVAHPPRLSPRLRAPAAVHGGAAAGSGRRDRAAAPLPPAPEVAHARSPHPLPPHPHPRPGSGRQRPAPARHRCRPPWRAGPAARPRHGGGPGRPARHPRAPAPGGAGPGRPLRGPLGALLRRGPGPPRRLDPARRRRPRGRGPPGLAGRRAPGRVRLHELGRPWRAEGRQYGLQVDAERDERMVPERETEAAVALLRDLHGEFGDWRLALAAYNQGPEAVRTAIAEGGTRDPWVLVEGGVAERLLGRRGGGGAAHAGSLRDPQHGCNPRISRGVSSPPPPPPRVPGGAPWAWEIWPPRRRWPRP